MIYANYIPFAHTAIIRASEWNGNELYDVRNEVAKDIWHYPTFDNL